MKKYTRTLPTNKNFRFYCTCTSQMLFEGIDLELNIHYNPQECKNNLFKKLQSIVENIWQFDLLIYLPGGIPFLKGELYDFFTEKVEQEVKRNIYGVITRPILNKDLDSIYSGFADILGINKELFFSPICDSTPNGLCNILCFLGYIIQNGKFSNKFHEISSSIIPFPPFSICLRKLIEDSVFTGRDIVTITSTLHTYFNHIINMSKPPEQVFEYTLKLCNIIINNENPRNAPIQKFYVYKEKKNFFDNERKIKCIHFWRGDLKNNEDEYYELGQIDVDKIDPKQQNFLSILTPKKISIVRGQDHCYLCLPEGNLNDCGYKIIDPMTNSEIHIQNFDELSHSKYFIESKDLSNLIDKESIEQAIMIVFDESLTSSPFSIQYWTSFVNNLFNYKISCLQGFIQFSNKVKLVFPLNFYNENIDLKMLNKCNTTGKPRLWDAISLACDELDINEIQYKNAVKRIVVFSNEDEDSKMNLKEISLKLLRSKIIVDSIIVNKTEKSKELTTLCHITGGYSLNPETVEDSIQIFEKISLLDIKSRQSPNQIRLIENDRKTKPQFLTLSKLTDEFIQNCVKSAKFDTDIPNKFKQIICEENHYSTPRYICCENKNNLIPDPRKRRILHELFLASRVMKENDPDFVIIPLSSMLDIWNLYLRGCECTPYEGKWFYLYVTFPQLYPIEPPNIQFISVPYHLNVSIDGKICFDLLNEAYDPSLHIVDIIQYVRQIFLIPDLKCPLRMDVLDVFCDDYKLYWRKVKDSIEKVGKNDYKEFFPNQLILKDNANDDFILHVDKPVPRCMY